MSDYFRSTVQNRICAKLLQISEQMVHSISYILRLMITNSESSNPPFCPKHTWDTPPDAGVLTLLEMLLDTSTSHCSSLEDHDNHFHTSFEIGIIILVCLQSLSIYTYSTYLASILTLCRTRTPDIHVLAASAAAFPSQLQGGLIVSSILVRMKNATKWCLQNIA